MEKKLSEQMREEAKLARENKAINAKILEIIADKEEGALRNKSVEELKAMLK